MNNLPQERHGHRRQPALGKAMPVTALLLNLNMPKASHARGGESSAAGAEEMPPRYFSIAEEQQPPHDEGNAEQPNAHQAALCGKDNAHASCLNCTQAADVPLSASNALINQLCQHLCNAECRQPQLSLSGWQRKDFMQQYEIAEALAKTSAMTATTQMKQRLAARKLELSMDPAAMDSCSDALGVVPAGDAAVPLPPSSMLAEYEPPRDLLLYLVRMGSFNSAPKINNVDSQDDGLELPKGLTNAGLLQHVQQLRGGDQLPLISRYFLKPLPLEPLLIGSEDVTDGMRCLKLNSVSRVCSSPIGETSEQIRLLQWNILSQTLGQNNDGFVRCPQEALTWEHRKYLIVQEILQNQPDVVCLQEVDHFKFLQAVLGCQNYEGIFYPKPDSPCLYIEENNGPDGCAIFYKRDKFNLLNYGTRVLEVWRVQSNQVAIAMRLQVKETGREFCVCTTHLKARHGALLAKLRNEQGRDLIRFVKQFAGDSPVMLCGDFNAEPIEPIYATVLSCDILKLCSAYADVKLEQQQHDNTVETDDINELVSQSIKREPAYTTWKIREDGEVCHTIDYVFYTPDQLKIKNCLGFPAGEQIGKNRTPSYQYPSDHFSLVCDFELLDEPLSQKSINNSHGTIQ